MNRLISIAVWLMFFYTVTVRGADYLTVDDVHVMSDAGIRVQFANQTEASVINKNIMPQQLLQAELLDLSGKSLYVLPSWLKKFKSLKKLDISNNHLRVNGVIEIVREMRMLDVLNISHNPLFIENAKNSLDELWSVLPNLAELYLNKTGGNTKNYGSMASMISLYRLDLSGNQIRNVEELQLRRLTNLEIVNLSNNNLSHDPLPYLPVSSIRLLDLRDNSLETLAFIDMPRLEIWELSGNGQIRLNRRYGDLFSLRSLQKLSYDSGSGHSSLSEIPEGLQKKLQAIYDKTVVQPILKEIKSQMVKIQKGCFKMDSNDVGENNKKRPPHQECITKDFYLGKYEVTQGQWQAIMGENPSKFKKGNNHPVENVSWNDVQRFINKLNKKTGEQYRLPTDAEWEYACRSGGREQRYCGGDNVSTYSWYEEDWEKGHYAVGGKSPNGLGLYDMSGNVSEWVQDSRNSSQNYYMSGPAGGGTYRVIRNGSWGNISTYVQSDHRSGNYPTYRYHLTGFRLARIVTF